jgi:benzoate membrane transport protein
MPLHVSHDSPALIAVDVGPAPRGRLVGAFGTATKDEAGRCPALPAFAVSAAGASFGGIGAVFRGLAAGLLAHGLEHGPCALRRRGGHG